ncbi:hypothetical protein [Vibrio quintilis]|uniref:Uncharacterized protein n=1 Tax=Vibrio quintilis TaxID=1117707 RepID=A0A1M7YU53_9VIBR|nr:hypothetical protein [Vibrio quintilis]SHO56190.1 hypothetical protein VQ7734_01959 [Vibrio quintilis]
MSQKFEKEFNLGGNIERALKGDYSLKIGEIFREALTCTVKHFWSFTPSIFILLSVQLIVFYIVLKLQIPDLSSILTGVETPEKLDPRLFQAIFVATFTFEVVSAPVYAGTCLMAMSHAAGLRTHTGHIAKGLQYTVSVILTTLISLILQGIAGSLFWILSAYLSVAFSHAILLICEKRLSIFQALSVSVRATNKKILPLCAIYFVLTLFMTASFLFYGISLIFVMPFFLHVKGILYRNMFGIKLTIVTNSQDNNDNNHKVFDA